MYMCALGPHSSHTCPRTPIGERGSCGIAVCVRERERATLDPRPSQRAANGFRSLFLFSSSFTSLSFSLSCFLLLLPACRFNSLIKLRLNLENFFLSLSLIPTLCNSIQSRFHSHSFSLSSHTASRYVYSFEVEWMR